MTVWQWLDQLDKAVFTFVHAKAYAPSLDGLMLLLRHGTTWIPLYLFILYWILRKENRKYAVAFILLSVACVCFTDSVSVRILKPLFGRLRPCHDEILQPVIRHIIDCAGLHSMPSSHASNHFGLAAFWFISIAAINNRKWYWLWLWAALICYAQVYVGKHYPGDILAGALFGTLTGLLFYKIFERWRISSGSTSF
ncbi:MAG TPA: phosphatase PAP2 family protein [Chitinophagaceae bacterium]|nr:phosphatase PAP2 family protein [Chitinophagaceae bacterium]